MEASAPPRPVEPRPPAARCGLLSYPGCPNPVSKPPNRIETTRKVDHTPLSTKHLKSVVLTLRPLESDGTVQPRLWAISGHAPLHQRKLPAELARPKRLHVGPGAEPTPRASPRSVMPM